MMNILSFLLMLARNVFLANILQHRKAVDEKLWMDII
jgi:hypothetical protein